MKTFKTILTSLILTLSITGMWARPLGNVESDKYHIHLYDTNGELFKTISNINGEVKGYSSDFFITQKDGWIYLYNDEGKLYKTMSSRYSGEVINVGESTFTTKKGNVTNVYSMSGEHMYSIEHINTGHKVRI